MLVCRSPSVGVNGLRRWEGERKGKVVTKESAENSFGLGENGIKRKANVSTDASSALWRCETLKKSCY